MLSTILTWIVIITICFLIGYAFLHILCLNGDETTFNIEKAVLLGVVVTTVYAEIFSVFSGLSGMAFLGIAILALICVVWILASKKTVKVKKLSVKLHFSKIRFTAIIIAFIGVLLWTNLVPQHYDTYLYHAQAIHWAEDYGLIPGLGTLHFRLAYNSAFMPLQALFSFKWLFGQSLHTINGLVTLLILTYNILTIRREDKIQCSDCLKIGVMLYIAYDCIQISSPNSDTFALLLVFYICTKWVEFAEREIKNYEPYAFLSVIAVYATSLKLSAGILVILCIYPAVMMVKQRKWISILKYLLLGIIIILPLMIRGYFISGYPLYPYDVFSFLMPDWKMNYSTLLADRGDIISWARGNYDVTRNNEPLFRWIGEWFRNINLLWKVVSILALISIIYLVITIIKKEIYKTNVSMTWILICTIGFVAFWLLSAPLPRYGIMYMIVLISIASYYLLRNCFRICKVMLPILFILIVIYGVTYIGYMMLTDNQMPQIVMQNDYKDKKVSSFEYMNAEFYVPSDSDQTGYWCFPSTMGNDIFEYIEFRGNTLEGGFRIRSEKIDK